MAFVAKKEANCDRDDPADDHKGDCWDHVAFDPEHKLVVAVVPEERTVENTEALAVTFLSLSCYNFCWCVRTLAAKDDEGRCVRRSPAMAAGLTDHVGSLSEWCSCPAVQHC